MTIAYKKYKEVSRNEIMKDMIHARTYTGELYGATYCSECGAYAGSFDKYCSKCGSEFSDEQPVAFESIEDKRNAFFTVMQEVADKLDLGIVHMPVNKEKNND